MKTTRQTRREAKGLFRLCLVNGLLDEGRVHEVVQRVIESKRRGYMALLSQFHRLIRLQCDRQTAEVKSAAPLDADLQSRINAELEHLYGPGLNVRFVHSPNLIGGMRIVVGNDVYDGSIRHKLDELEKSFWISSLNGNKTQRAA
jgi:F-type H+-transporting ATPase subunit delta